MKLKIDTSVQLNSSQLNNLVKKQKLRYRSMCADVVNQNKDKIIILRGLGFTWSDIARLYGMSITSLRNAMTSISAEEDFCSLSRMDENNDQKLDISKQDQCPKYRDIEIVFRLDEKNKVSLALR